MKLRFFGWGGEGERWYVMVVFFFLFSIPGSSRRLSDETGVKCLAPIAAPAQTSAKLFVLTSATVFVVVVVVFSSSSSSSSYALCAFTELLSSCALPSLPEDQTHLSAQTISLLPFVLPPPRPRGFLRTPTRLKTKLDLQTRRSTF